jgi:hypothetical protein
VVGGPGTGRDEGGPAGPQSLEEPVVRRRVDARDPGELGDVVPPGRLVQVDQGVRPEGGQDPLTQTVGGELLVVVQVGGGRVGGGDDLDLEAVEQRPGPELGSATQAAIVS